MTFARLLAIVAAASCVACTQAHHTTYTASPSGPSLPAASSSLTAEPTPTPTPTPTRTPTPTPRPTPRIPPLSSRATAAGLVDIRTVVPDAIIDLRYATQDNFVGVRLYPLDARCLVHRSMVPGLRVAARALRRAGYLLVFWDCYRPHAVQVHMFRIVPNPNWVARPGPYATSHEAGRSVDVTLAHRALAHDCPAARLVQHHCLLDMGTGFDDFTPRAYAYASAGVSVSARQNRAVLRDAMSRGGLTVYSGEWWHFDGPGSFVHRRILDAPLN